eukprot:CAMPEP_0201878150 /NCGR_PEP_ID=MMETSP0902-20130614/9396_1 /ASSEMBLY_ACC=CAM_ASM_000551 /TAXON_ID=420261 /ORGANISM="Thalassiosira antarctica, Strain CCMP982" /LENGTH=685 /DNA_ID=CAMNT_0048405757 /DNA_START=45 /DNA_END=2099 /DNA_ORIENTATION=+
MAVTPPEEIAKQHAEACTIIESQTPCAPRIDHGEVPLHWKEKPTVSSISSNTTVAFHPTTLQKAGNNNANPNSPDESVEVLVNSSNRSDVAEWCVSSRGQVDVSPIVKLITEGVNEPASPFSPETAPKTKNNVLKKNTTKKSPSPQPTKKTSKKAFSPSNLWTEENAAQNNVKLTRPSHDAWGIKKIILVFCDDFLHTIYTLPWYQQRNRVGKDMHAAIQPILDTLGIQQNQLVRCLLAGLPPGVTIPVHHDTGEWVKYSHRIHVPIIVPDPSKVLFRCGLTEQSLERIDCTPGHIFEMNNQAKHAVTNAGSEFRVHLILDYVSPTFFQTRAAQNCPVQRITLAPGELITQTRRSIDRALDANKSNHPAYLILGAQKAGTTALYEYINQHPWVVRAKRRETHCFDWRWDDTLHSTAERRRHCLDFYHAHTMQSYPSLRTGDSTPSYLLDYFRVIPRLKECFEHGPQLIVMTRDPIRRALSHYVMVTSMDGSPEQLAVRGMEWRNKTLEEVLEQDVLTMKEDGLLPYWDVESKTLDRGVFDTFIDSPEEDEAWERYVTTRIPLNTGSYSPLARGLYALQCRPWFRSFAREKFLVMKLEDMSPTNDDGVGGKGVQWAVNRSMEHLGLPQYEVPDVEKKNAREYNDPLEGKEELRGWLERFFAPHNERFGRMMVKEMGYDEEDWSSVW